MVQRLHKFVHCINNHDYEPFNPPAADVTSADDFAHVRKVLTEEELKEVEEFTPVRTTHLTLLKPHVCLYYNDLPPYDVTKTSVKTRSSKSVSVCTLHSHVCTIQRLADCNDFSEIFGVSGKAAGVERRRRTTV